MGSHRAERRAPQRDRRADPTATPASGVPTPTAEIPVVRDTHGGKRRALRHVGRARTPLTFMPSLRAAVGVTVLALAAGGVVTAPDLTQTAGELRVAAPSALGGSDRTGAIGASDRGSVVSRDSSDRDTGGASDADLVAQAERQAEQRSAKLGRLAQAAEQEAGEIVENAWVLPVSGYRLTASFGEYGLWSSAHTGLDFAAAYGAPIVAVAGGTVTEAGYDGAYGNKTVVTLPDGTEIWYAHQSSFAVSVGDTVRSGDPIGYVGSTGNSTGAHLHLEVRPGGGDPVDPYAALQVNGITP